MSKRDAGLILKATFSKTQRADCEMTTDKYNERDSPRGPAPSQPRSRSRLGAKARAQIASVKTSMLFACNNGG